MSGKTQSIANNPGLLAQIAIGASVFSSAPNTNPQNLSRRRGWPARHCRRQGWYRFHIIKMFQILGGPERDNIMTPSAKPWSEHELAVFKEVREKLAALYNNRYEEYYKMRTLERGMEYYPRNKENKFILK